MYVISVLFCYAFLHACLLMPCGHLLGKGWPHGSRLWCLIVTMSLPIGILGQVWYLIGSIPDLCPLSYFVLMVAYYDSVIYARHVILTDLRDDIIVSSAVFALNFLLSQIQVCNIQPKNMVTEFFRNKTHMGSADEGLTFIAYAQSRKSVCCSQTQSLKVIEGSILS